MTYNSLAAPNPPAEPRGDNIRHPRFYRRQTACPGPKILREQNAESQEVFGHLDENGEITTLRTTSA
jgi:hypothetical protein